MQTEAKSINQYNTYSFKNDELQSSPQMILFETEFKPAEKQIIHFEKVFKFHFKIFVNLRVGNQNL